MLRAALPRLNQTAARRAAPCARAAIRAGWCGRRGSHVRGQWLRGGIQRGDSWRGWRGRRRIFRQDKGPAQCRQQCGQRQQPAIERRTLPLLLGADSTEITRAKAHTSRGQRIAAFGAKIGLIEKRAHRLVSICTRRRQYSRPQAQCRAALRASSFSEIETP